MKHELVNEQKNASGLYRTGHGYSLWVEILNNEASAPKSGIYLFVCMEDNHFEYVLSRCTYGERLKNSMIRSSHHKEPDCLLAYHPISEFSQGDIIWRNYKLGDKANICGIYVWFIKDRGVEKYVYHRYRKGEDMLQPFLDYESLELSQEYVNIEFIAYHGCFEYSESQLGFHNHLQMKNT